jgi:hypothetical protein
VAVTLQLKVADLLVFLGMWLAVASHSMPVLCRAVATGGLIASNGVHAGAQSGVGLGLCSTSARVAKGLVHP